MGTLALSHVIRLLLKEVDSQFFEKVSTNYHVISAELVVAFVDIHVPSISPFVKLGERERTATFSIRCEFTCFVVHSTSYGFCFNLVTNLLLIRGAAPQPVSNRTADRLKFCFPSGMQET
jgi:hypothetical protein